MGRWGGEKVDAAPLPRHRTTQRTWASARGPPTIELLTLPGERMPAADVAPATLADLAQLLREAEGFADVAAALRAGGAGTIDGAWGSSAALSAAALATEAPATVLVVLAHPGDVDPWVNDLASLTGRRPAVFPAFESWPPEPAAFDESPGRRLRTLQKLAAPIANAPGSPKVLLATMGALMQPVP